LATQAVAELVLLRTRTKIAALLPRTCADFSGVNFTVAQPTRFLGGWPTWPDETESARMSSREAVSEYDDDAITQSASVCSIIDLTRHHCITVTDCLPTGLPASASRQRRRLNTIIIIVVIVFA